MTKPPTRNNRFLWTGAILAATACLFSASRAISPAATAGKHGVRICASFRIEGDSLSQYLNLSPEQHLACDRDIVKQMWERIGRKRQRNYRYYYDGPTHHSIHEHGGYQRLQRFLLSKNILSTNPHVPEHIEDITYEYVDGEWVCIHSFPISEESPFIIHTKSWKFRRIGARIVLSARWALDGAPGSTTNHNHHDYK